MEIALESPPRFVSRRHDSPAKLGQLVQAEELLGPQALVRKGQSKDGGWGPYVTAPSEPFDTALVLLALKQYPKLAGNANMIRHGRDYLLATQKTDGSWQETTRPAGGDSYAQRISTTGWATLALLLARKE